MPLSIASSAPSRDSVKSLIGSCDVKCVICFAGPPEIGTLQKLGIPSNTSTYSRERLSGGHIQQLAVAGRSTVFGGCDPEVDMIVTFGNWSLYENAINLPSGEIEGQDESRSVNFTDVPPVVGILNMN